MPGCEGHTLDAFPGGPVTHLTTIFCAVETKGERKYGRAPRSRTWWVGGPG